MSPALLLGLALLCPTAAPPPPRLAVRGPVLFTELGGARSLVTLRGETKGDDLAVFGGMGRVVAGLEWGPAYMLVDAGVPGMPEAAVSVALGLRLTL